MTSPYCRSPLWECTQKLTLVALGKEKADLVVKNAKLINVCTREILDNVSVAVACGRIACVGDCTQCIGEKTTVIDAEGKYLAPSFLDGHMHIESSMMTTGEFAKAAIPHGTSAVFMDPHEICNVLGLKGVKYMLEDATRTPLKAMLTTPSCVPAVPGFEDVGAEINPEDVRETMGWKECVGLGEMMNFPGLLAGAEKPHAIVQETLKAGKIVTGHYPANETGCGLNAYIASGIRCCHESTQPEEALAKMRLGMYAQLREGSAWHDLHALAVAITKTTIDTRFACLVTDDTHPSTISTIGHLDHVLRRAVEEGIDPVVALQMVTINTAQCYQVDHEMGSVTPSKCADFVLMSSLERFAVTDVFINGELVAQNGKMLHEFKPYTYPADAFNTIHIDPVTEDAFVIPATGTKADVRVIQIIPAKTITQSCVDSVPIVDGKLCADESRDLLKAVVFDRHHKDGTRGFGFVRGFGIKHGALAQTVAHDAHNLLVIGTNDADMVVAANALIKTGGGAVAVKDGKVIGLVPLPIAGLLSDKPLAETAAAVDQLAQAWRDLGCTAPSPFMTMGGLSLACIPELRLTNRGLVDCVTFKFVDLIVKTY